MYILIPVDSASGYDAKITTVIDKQKWAMVHFDAGKAKSVQFCDDWTQQSDIEWFDYVILENKFENYMDFINEGMMCLCRREEETVEDLVSAFAFKELDEV